MEVKRASSHDMLMHIVAPLTVWAVTKVLETPHVKKAMGRVDDKFYKQRRKAEHSLVRASERAINNGVWLAAGVAAIVTGVGLLTKAVKR